MEKDILSDQVNSLFEKERWSEARKLLEVELKQSPRSHWVLDRLSVTYYEQKDYQKALTLIKKAFDLAPQCPLALWDYAGTCAALGQTQKAIRKYHALIEMYPDGFDEDECGEDKNWASSLVMDCFFRLGACFQEIKRNDMATLFFDDYLNLRRKHKTLPSLYSTAEAKKRKAMIDGQNPASAANSILPEARRAHGMLVACQ
jgi:tetratricopeptide (TPR) repeat protein